MASIRRAAALVSAKMRDYAGLLMIGHSLFSLPFALAALLYASGGRPGWRLLIFTGLAFLGARNAANALNRVVDRRLDAENPRTAGRHIPSGRVSALEALALAGAFFLLLCAAAWLISPLCFMLIPIPAALMLLYSYTKRFTWLSHLVLGITSAAAAAGGWIAYAGHLGLRGFLLVAANGAWVTGFDIIYQGLDAEWDRAHNLHSVPADFGPLAAQALALLCHAGALGFLAAFGLAIRVSILYWIGLAVIAQLMALQHILLQGRGKPSRARILFSSYSLNQILGPLFLVVSCADIYLGGPS
jgi:4-hydroxybenzoate polyprenyltransferase